MYSSLVLIALLQYAVIFGEASLDIKGSKVWSIYTNGSYKCGNTVKDVVLCDDDNIWIQACYCMFFLQDQNSTILGNCMFTCYYVNFHEVGRTYYEMDRYAAENGTQLNEAMCSTTFANIYMNREGRFCGRCKEGYGLAMYSYHYTSCIPCTDYSYKNWLLYFTVALLPLTIFYLLVVTFKLNVTSSRFNGVVFILQCIMSPIQQRVFDGWVWANGGYPRIVFKVLSTLLAFVNLDFFRTLYPYFCLHPKLNILHVISLDYIIAVYPFFLIFMTYILVTMHDNNYRLVVWAWKPFKWCLSQYQGQLNFKASLVEIFASFILLSNVKILCVCFDLLAPTTAWDPTGAELSKRYLYYDATIEYFGADHLPFALLALVMGFVFVFLPSLLLVLYPCRSFQRCLNCLGFQSQTLRIFMDAFQGSYKTEPHDLRQFSALYLFLRFFLLFTMTAFASMFYLAVNAFLMILSTLLFSIFQPYRDSCHNKFDIASLLMLSLFYVSFISEAISVYLNFKWWQCGLLFFGIYFVLLLAHVIIVVMYHCKLPAMIINIVRRPSQEQDSLDNVDRREPPAAGTPLLSPYKKHSVYSQH